jgi:RNA polymerase sigma factor (sigma-70 family)
MLIENVNQEVTTMEEEELKKEDVLGLQYRTTQLFQVIEMCKDNEEQVQICRNEIIELNIRLVPHVLKKYRPFGDDEFQLGCLGLIIATRTFNPERGVPFVNYACFCIERELHKAHRRKKETFEFMLGNSLTFLDEALSFQNGDEADKYDIIPDEDAEAAFDEILEQYDLTNFFEKVILPSIEQIANKTKGQKTTINFEKWRDLELRYILEMAEVDSQKARITFSSIAKELGVSIQNIRMRHQRVIKSIKAKCIELGIHL